MVEINFELPVTADYLVYRDAIRENLQEFCLNCFYWYPNFNLNGTQGGQCRRSSPILVNDKGIAIWPITGPKEGCGDFECFADQIMCDDPDGDCCGEDSCCSCCNESDVED